MSLSFSLSLLFCLCLCLSLCLFITVSPLSNVFYLLRFSNHSIYSSLSFLPFLCLLVFLSLSLCYATYFIFCISLTTLFTLLYPLSLSLSLLPLSLFPSPSLSLALSLCYLLHFFHHFIHSSLSSLPFSVFHVCLSHSFSLPHSPVHHTPNDSLYHSSPPHHPYFTPSTIATRIENVNSTENGESETKSLGLSTKFSILMTS